LTVTSPREYETSSRVRLCVPCLPEKEQAGSAKFSGAFDVSAFDGSSSAERGEKTFRHLEFLGYSAKGELLFAESNSITLKLEEAPDPATLIRLRSPFSPNALAAPEHSISN
jgi:hypothetical protein